ncbi:Fic family protein [Psychromonas sp. MME2]|uniref:Fic/DOC family protein n=1 Tax=unclassified Psychromonas TaxID=2614957 RepID=UPI00339D12B7
MISEAEINEAESLLLVQLYQYLFDGSNPALSSLTVADISEWHRKWLGNIYEWAGTARSVNMRKGSFDFSAARQIPSLLDNFEKSLLNKFDDLPNISEESLIHFLAKVHVEFILIHPFREGNDRIARLLLDVIADKAGFSLLNYNLWDEHKAFYFKAIQAGVAGDYQHMERLIGDVLTPKSAN